MKPLSLSRPLVIMMLGVPGAGKSFFARQFSDTFGAPVVSIDRLRYELFAESEYSKDEEVIVDRVATLQIEELVKTSKTFIVDGVIGTRVNRANIEKMAKQNGYGTLIIWVQTDPQTTKVRSLKRNPKRPFNEYNVSLSPEVYEKLARRVSPPLPREPYIVISGKHTYATQAKIVLKKLVSPHNESTDVAHEEQLRTDTRHAIPPTRRSVNVQYSIYGKHSY